MKTVELKTIKELVEKVQSGEIDGNTLEIMLDNDNVYFGSGDEGEDPDNFFIIEVEEAGGYRDILPLYSLLFPKSNVSWC